MNGWDAVVAFITAEAVVQLAKVYAGYRAAKRRDEARAAAAKGGAS